MDENEVATQEGVTEQGGQDTTVEERKPVVTPRDAMLDQIESMVENARIKEEEEAGIVRTPQEEAPAASLPGVLEDGHLAAVKVRVKVDGHELEVPVADLVQGYQKTAAADRRLEEAALERKRLDARSEELRLLEAQIAAAQVDNRAAAVPDEEVDDRLQAAMEALVEGDPAKAAQALREVIGKGRQAATPLVNREEIVTEVKGQLRAEQVRDTFLRENPVFAPDPKTGELTPERQYGDFIYLRDYKPLVDSGQIDYGTALNKTRDAVFQVFKPAASTTTQQKDERTERKSRLDNLPTAGGARPVVTASDKDETVGDIIDEMRKARGLA